MKAKKIANLFIEKHEIIKKEEYQEYMKNVIMILMNDFDKLLIERKIGTGTALVSLIDEFDKKLNAVNIRLYRKYKIHFFKKDGFSPVLKVLVPDIHKEYLKYK